MVSKKWILVLSVILLGCPKEPTPENCKEIIEFYKQINFKVVLHKKRMKRYYHVFDGKDLETQKDSVFKYDDAPWFDHFYYFLEVNDTVIKEKGSLKVEIRKKDTLFISEWTCGAVFINGVSVREFDRKKHYILR